MKRMALGFFLALLAIPSVAYGQEYVEQEYLEKARVLEATPSQTIQIEGTDVSAETQTITIEVLEGPDQGQVVTFENDFTQVETGDVIYVRHIVGGFDLETWSVSDPYRLDVLMVVAAVFLLLTFVFGGWQGIRGLASLAGSLVLIFYLLLPGIHSGYSPVLISIGVSSLIILVGSYITHGFNRTTTAAVLGMIGTVIVTGLGAYWAIHAADLSGFTSDENVYLNFNTGGQIDMIGLLFGGIMIGLLGVLYDIAIGQAVAVDELFRTGTMTRLSVFKRGMRIGREHIGALINTLAIAYVGASLPLFLLLNNATVSAQYVINSELFATEILRILIGSIGLILAVPVTTLIAAYLLSQKGIKSYAE
jgi:uncharacterized membrane protein